MVMKKIVIVVIIFLMMNAANASISRLYIGELDAQFMAGVDTRIDFGPFFVGGDVRTIIRKTVMDEEEKVVGFMPDRTDYKTGCGFVIGDVEIEYAHTCYHRVISSQNLQFYAGNENPEDTNTIAIKTVF
jgi:hypothetical protein